MAFASGSRHGMSYVEESTFGTTPSSPTLTPIRHNSTTLGLEKETIESEEIRSDRQIADVRHGVRTGSGDIVGELSYETFDDFLAGALCGAWSGTADTGEMSLSAADGEFTRSTGDFSADGFTAGAHITVTGFTDTGNNGRFLVDSVTATKLTVTPLEGQTMSTESGSGDEQIVQFDTLKAGTTRKSFTVQREFADITQYQIFTGCQVNTLSTSIEPNSMVNVTFGMWAQDMAAQTSKITGSTQGSATTSSPVDTFSGTIDEGGSAISIVTSMELSLENGLEGRNRIGSKTSAEPSISRSNLSGTVTAYFEDKTLLDKFLNETASSITVELLDTDGNGYRFVLPNVKYTTGRTDVEGEGDITIPLEFRALYDATNDTNFIIEKVAA